MSNNTETKINTNKRYFVLMHPLEIVSPLLRITMKSSNSREKWVECYIDESRYKVADGYKVTLKAIDERYGSESFYQCDFISLLKAGRIIEKTNFAQHTEEVFWREPLCGAAYLQHSAYVVVPN